MQLRHPFLVALLCAASLLPARGESLSQNVWDKAKPTIDFSGYLILKYNYIDQSSASSDGGFDVRFLRLAANGYCFEDFYYRFQMELNGFPGSDTGVRIVDAFVEWQHWKFLRLKMGQFKRPFGIENPMSPLAVGLGAYAQISSKLASLSDRCGESKTSGRDLGFQLQGDFLKMSDGHYLFRYQAGVFNGQGINHSDKDKSKDLIGGFYASPIKALSIGVYGWHGQYTNEDFTDEETQWKKVDRNRWGVGLSYEENNWTVRAEYIASRGGIVSKKSAPTRSDGWYATVGIPIIKSLKTYVRWDCYRDSKKWSDLIQKYDLAVNYSLGKYLYLQATYTYTHDRATTGDSNYNTIDFQVAARF